MTLFRLALRSHLGGFVAATAVGTLFAIANTVGYAQVAGDDPQQRAIFAMQMEILGRQLSYILPIPVQLDTLAGYLQWRHFGNLPIVYGFWALLAASGAGRGDEERGLVEQWVAAGVRRSGYLATRVAAFAIALAASLAVMSAAALAGAVAADEPLAADAVALQSLALGALGLCCYAFALLVAQLAATRRAAAGLAGVILLALFLVNSASRVGGGPQDIRWLSPFFAYDRTTALLEGGSFDGAATAALLASALALAAIAALAFRARDLGAPLLQPVRASGPATVRPSGDPLLRLPVLAMLDQQRLWIAGWAVGMAALGAFFVSLTRLIVDGLASVPGLRTYFERAGIDAYESFVGVIWGSTAMFFLSLFAIFQVSGWVADDAEGRLEAVLAQPVSRTRVVLERVGSLLAAAAVITFVASVAVYQAASREEMRLDADRFTLGSALLVTVPLAFGAVGAVVSGSLPRLAVPALTAVAIASYFVQQFAPLFDWPEWVENTSVYALYGTPISTGIEWGGIAALTAVGVGGTALGIAAMRRRDVGR